MKGNKEKREENKQIKDKRKKCRRKSGEEERKR
jgi:hypothetical protein